MRRIKLFLAIIISCMVIGLVQPVTNVEAATKLTLAQLKAKFPAGKYWNHQGSKTNNPDGWTTKPCASHDNCSLTGGCSCNSYGGAIQCMGFTFKLGYDAYGIEVSKWKKLTGSQAKTYLNDSLKPGDIVRYATHSIFVIKVDGDTVSFGDCNSDHKCIIKWSRTKTKKSILDSGLSSIRVAPSTLNTGTATNVTYTITYDANGGIGGSSTTAKYGNKITLPSTSKIQKTGCDLKGFHLYREADKKYYTNKGWQTQANIDKNKYTKKVYNPGSTPTIDDSWTTDPKNQSKFKFIAIWENRTYTIKYMSNDGTNGLVKESVKLNSSFTIKDTNLFTRTGYKLVGWNACRQSQIGTTYYVSGQGWLTDSDIKANGYTKRVYTPGQTFTLDAKSWLSNSPNYNVSVFEFYAVWEKLSTPITSVTLNKTSITLNKGNSETLTATINPSNTTDDKTLTWSSSNTNVATVSNGKVTAVNAGTATITVKTSNGKTATCSVTVTNPIKSVILNKTSLTLNKGVNEILIATIKPSDTPDSKTLTWSSSNTNVATVNQEGKVTAVAAGTATITVKTVNGKTAACNVTVKAVPITSVTLDKTSLALTKNTCDKLTATINPSNTTDSKTLTWTSSNTNVVTVQDGVLTCVGVGTATITVKTSNGKTATCSVTVKAPAVKNEVVRLYGQDRYATAYKTADELKTILGVSKFSSIIVASGENFADALAGSYLSAKKNAPIIMTGKYDYLMNDTIKYIKNNLKSGGTVYILGGKAAIPESFEKGLSGYTVKRLAGNDRYETNLKILKEAKVTNEEILVCTGSNFADSLSASATGLPILLVDTWIRPEQKEFLNSVKGNKITVVGGTSAIAKWMENDLKAYGSVSRVAGNTRYETSTMVAKKYFSNPTNAVVAYAKNFPDGLSGGPLAYAKKAPLILTDSESYNYNVAYNYMKSYNIKNGYVLGGSGLVSDSAVKTIFNMSTSDSIKVK